MNKFLKTRIKSFEYAFAGLWLAIRTQKNIWVYITATLLVVIFGLSFRISTIEWILIILTITIVWTAEILNTAIETVVNLINPGVHPMAKAAKDLGAASVLVAALSSAIIGVIIFGPLVWNFFLNLFR